MIELQTELARVLRRRQEEIQVPGRRYMANETYLLESGGCAFVPMATLVAAANAGPSDCIDAFRASIEAIVARMLSRRGRELAWPRMTLACHQDCMGQKQR